MKDVAIIGAGLTGLTLAFLLKKQGYNVIVLEKADRVGGAIQTHIYEGYVFEEGPNTGVVSNPEVAELFEMLGCNIETANDSAEKRLILKNHQWHPLPSGAISFMKTPLFTAADKIRILFEPLRKKGTDPDESVASLAARRIGQSFVDYAVNPFISGIYAGDPEQLTTRYALPKLYNLEQDYGSFIGGGFKKSRQKKTERDKKASRKVFSVYGGLRKLIDLLEEKTGKESIICDAQQIRIGKKDENYEISYLKDNECERIAAKTVISTIGAYALPEILPFIPKSDMDRITKLNYAKIVQVAVALKENSLDPKYISFGGLIPKKENRNLLGVLFPSYCFSDRSPDNCSTLAVYLGGVKHPELFDLSDDNLRSLVLKELEELFDIPAPSVLFTKIFRHPYAIPQYDKWSGDRFDTIKKIEAEYPGLIIAGNLRNGIGMSDRIKQAFDIADQLKR